MEQLQEEVADLQTQLEQVRQEQAALLQAELAGARATWNRDKQQELSASQARMEEAYRSKLLEQRRALEEAREDAASQRERLLQTEARLQRTLESREEEWRRESAAKEEATRRRTRGEMLSELRAALADVHARFATDPKTDQQDKEDTGTSGGTTTEDTIAHFIKMSCRDIVNAAVAQAKEGWRKVSFSSLVSVC